MGAQRADKGKKKSPAAKPRRKLPRQVDRERMADVMRARRLELGLTLGEVAERAGCAKSYLSLLENHRKPAPSSDACRALEKALRLPHGRLVALAELERTPPTVLERLARLEKFERAQRETIRTIGTDLDAAYKTGRLREVIERLDPDSGRELEPAKLPMEVPLINSVAAGYPTEFTDLGYPARVADEYIRAPDLDDPDAFAARVVGESMAPEYVEGDIVVFSPARDVENGRDCFCRLEPDHETTFKRVFFENGPRGQALIRLQPLNPAFPARVLPREQVAGLYPAVSVTRKL